MRILDLFSGAGGAAFGLHQAFPEAEITGVDIRPQPRYPFRHVVADAMTFPLDGFDLIWASPPCQRYTKLSKRWPSFGLQHPDLVGPIRERLARLSAPWIIENVPGSPVRGTVLLCGSMFGLDVRRHRLFECSFPVMAHPCQHHRQPARFRSLDKRQIKRGSLAGVVGVHGHLNYPGELALRQAAMGIAWMTNEELVEAIPPAFSRYLAQFVPLDRRAVA